MTPYAEIDGITIYHCRLEDIVDELPQVDAVITDPPYGETSLEWDVWPMGWPTMLVTKTNSLWCFGSFRMFMEQKVEFTLWTLAQEIVWEKHNGSGFASDRFKRVHELAVHWYKGKWSDVWKQTPKVPRTGERKVVKNRASARSRHLSSINDCGYEDDGTRLMKSVIPIRSCHGHAFNETQKPEGIIAPLMSYSVPPGGTVLDCFCGSGTTGVVARRQGKRAILIDNRESQCEEAAKRLQQAEWVL